MNPSCFGKMLKTVSVVLSSAKPQIISMKPVSLGSPQGRNLISYEAIGTSDQRKRKDPTPGLRNWSYGPSYRFPPLPC